jgi:nucleoid DNA-binding protein
MSVSTVSQAELRRRTLELMEDDLKIKPGQAVDFVKSLVAAVEEAVNNGEKVSLFGIAVLTPGFRLAKPKRKGVDPRTGEEKTLDATPNKTTIRAGVTKKIKDCLPTPVSATGKLLKAEAEDRKAKAAERAAEREKQAAADERKAKRGKK